MKRSSETGSFGADLTLRGAKALHLSFIQGTNFVPGDSSRLPFAPHCSELDDMPTAKPLSNKGLGRGRENSDRMGPIMMSTLKFPPPTLTSLSMLPPQQNWSFNKEDWDRVEMVTGYNKQCLLHKLVKSVARNSRTL